MKEFWLGGEQIWHDFGQKYKEHEIQERDDLVTTTMRFGIGHIVPNIFR